MPLSHPAATCTESLKLLADFWHLRIIEALSLEGEQRFCELQRTLDNVNPATLTKKLGVLEEAKIISRRETNDQHVTYALTKRGTASLQVLTAIKKFSND